MSTVPENTTGREREGAASLWRHFDFLKYWAGQSVSRFGAQLATLALPLAAIEVFEATAGQLGLLNAAAFAPYLVVTLLAGVWIDRRRKRTVLIAADLGRFLTLAAIPLLALAGFLEIHHLYLIAFTLGTFAVLFDVAGTAYLPSLVDRDQLLDGNSKLQASIVVSQSGGPAAAGVLVQVMTAPFTLLIGAFASLMSVLALLSVSSSEEQPKPSTQRGNTFAEIRSSIRFIAQDKYLRFLTLRSGVNNLFFLARNTVLPLFVLQVLGLSSSALGLVLGMGAVGALVGAALAKRMADWFGPGRVIAVAYGASSLFQIMLPLAMGPPAVALGIMVVMFFFGGLFMTIGNTNVATFQQMLIPKRRLAKVVAGMRTVTWGSMPLGALLGGALGSIIGIREALFVTAAGFLLSALWIALSPVARLRTMPEQLAEEESSSPREEEKT
ncbi:MFS transporter [Nocardiopsis deserti]|uniref:MFS transporter n=1 Tax=Nocardiopsis deserti TaxID=2605988 RepID=UPI0012392378|nr:MFS transporter [Nocardiopsis deserti]